MTEMIATPYRAIPDEDGFQYISYLDFSSDYERLPRIGETIVVLPQTGGVFEATVVEKDDDPDSQGAIGIQYISILGEL